jgi:uncharacterized protein YkwD
MQAPVIARRRYGRATALLVVVALGAAGLVGAPTAAPATTMLASAVYKGSPARVHLNQPIVGMAPTPDGGGYWLVATDGGIFTFGDAHFYGSTGNIRLNRPIVGITSTPSGHGYWMVASDGGIFSFGDAHFYGSTGNIRLNKPIVSMTRTIDGRGYWMVASDGGIFSFGDAHFYGSTGNIRLRRPIIGMARTPTGHGYWMAASDGGIFTFGDARYYGSEGGQWLSAPIAGMSSNPTAPGYWMVSADGHVYSFGHATNLGSATNLMAGQPAINITSAPSGWGYWVATRWGGVDTATATGMHIDPNLIATSGPQAIEFELIDRINTERVARHEHPVYLDSLLEAFAVGWAQHLAATKTFVHQNLETILTFSQGRLEEAGENLFAGSGPGADDAGTAHYALMNSAPHRTNILMSAEGYVGVGAACMHGELVVVEDFGTGSGVPLPPSTTPSLQPFASPGQGGAHC